VRSPLDVGWHNDLVQTDYTIADFVVDDARLCEVGGLLDGLQVEDLQLKAAVYFDHVAGVDNGWRGRHVHGSMALQE